MKKVRIVFAIMVLIVMGAPVKAQTLITSTTVSTSVVTQPEHKKGLVFRPETGLGIEINDVTMMFDLNGTFAYQFNSYFAAGLGLGLTYFANVVDINDYYLTYYIQEGFFTFPLFVDLRVYFRDKKWSPFVDVKLGYNTPFIKYQDKELQEMYMYDGYEITSNYSYYGPGINCTLGMQCKNLDFGLKFGYSKLNVKHEYRINYMGNSIEESGKDVMRLFDPMSLMFTISYNFHITKQ